MSRLTRFGGTLVRTIGGRTLLGLVVLLVAYQVWIAVTAGGKIADGVTEQPDQRGRYSVDVELGFPPERFHILDMQDYGRIRGTTDNVIHLNGVAEDGIDAIARKYWVEEIRPGEPSVSLSDILNGD